MHAVAQSGNCLTQMTVATMTIMEADRNFAARARVRGSAKLTQTGKLKPYTAQTGKTNLGEAGLVTKAEHRQRKPNRSSDAAQPIHHHTQLDSEH